MVDALFHGGCDGLEDLRQRLLEAGALGIAARLCLTLLLLLALPAIVAARGLRRGARLGRRLRRLLLRLDLLLPVHEAALAVDADAIRRALLRPHDDDADHGAVARLGALLTVCIPGGGRGRWRDGGAKGQRF